MLEQLIAEATDCDFKAALETKKPKSWLKSVSAFANGTGGTLIFGVDNNLEIVGLPDAQTDAEAISRLIKERIRPLPDFALTATSAEGKNILILSVNPGRSTPYYYRGDGVMETFVRIGNETVLAPPQVLNRLVLKGMNRTYDSLISEFDFKDYSFSKLRERYKTWTGTSMEDKFFDSAEIRSDNGKMTNAGALLADDSPIRHSRLFCTRWNGLDKSGGVVDALDSAEYSGSLIILLNEGIGFVKRNMKTMWKKTSDSRIEMPDYCERSVFEALVNGLIHRDYLVLGSEVHIDIYDDRMTITSPGGMADGTRIQERDILSVASARRNPILADVFGRLGYMERQGSGFKKITDAYLNAYNYREGLAPTFFSDSVSFQVTLFNLNYSIESNEKTGLSGEKQAFPNEKTGLSGEKQAFPNEKTGLLGEKQAFDILLESLPYGVKTKENIKKVYDAFGTKKIFARSDVMTVTGLTSTPVAQLMRKMKDKELIEQIFGHGRGKYRFKSLK